MPTATKQNLRPFLDPAIDAPCVLSVGSQPSRAASFYGPSGTVCGTHFGFSQRESHIERVWARTAEGLRFLSEPVTASYLQSAGDLADSAAPLLNAATSLPRYTVERMECGEADSFTGRASDIRGSSRRKANPATMRPA